MGSMPVTLRVDTHNRQPRLTVWNGIARIRLMCRCPAPGARWPQSPPPAAAATCPRRRASRARRPCRAPRATTWPGSGTPLLLIHSINAAGLGLRGAADLRARSARSDASMPSTCRASASPTARTARLRVRALRRRGPRHAGRDRRRERRRPGRCAGDLAGLEFLARAATERPDRARTPGAGDADRVQPSPTGNCTARPGQRPARSRASTGFFTVPALEPRASTTCS